MKIVHIYLEHIMLGLTTSVISHYNDDNAWLWLWNMFTKK